MRTPKQPAKTVKSSRFDFSLPLPRGYNPADALNFHGRDKEQVSERVTETGFSKGILLNDIPAVVDVDFTQSKKEAICTVSADGKTTDEMQAQARDIGARLLGLLLDPKEFAAFASADPVFGPLTKKQKSLRIVQSPSIFEALTWAVMGQQINVSFAVSLRRTFIQLANRRHSSGLWCYPSPADATQIPLEELTSRQYSLSKAETLLRLSRLIASGELELSVTASNPITAICEALLAIKGIGPWTVNYALLRGFGHADCSLHGDVAVRSAIGNLWEMEVRPDAVAAEALLQRYSPHRTMAAAHLWASLKKQGSY